MLKPKSMVYKKLLGTREAVIEKFKRAPSKEWHGEGKDTMNTTESSHLQGTETVRKGNHSWKVFQSLKSFWYFKQEDKYKFCFLLSNLKEK